VSFGGEHDISGRNAGEMEEDAEYQRQLDLFVKSSTEKGIELVKIGEIIAGLPRRRYFLDIGAGGGDLTIPVSQSFDRTTVVEPNERQAEYLKKRSPHFHIYNGFWENVELGSQRFDFILCSHVLYYIEEGTWLTTIERMYEYLEDKGCIAIVLQSPIGEVADFFNEFTHYDVNILELWRDLIQVYGDDAIEVRYFMNEIWTESLDDMVTIGLFLLIDRRFNAYKEQIRQYFESHHKKPEGYRIKQDEILLVIRKLNP
jgi:ubiquinone/menaquinone biosynthesis C-methylase UbiE